MQPPTRRTFAGALAGGALGAAAPAPKLNFIFILIDDMGWRDLGCFGSTFYETPNIDRLAAQGMRFTNAYAACPVCSPTRAAIMTGKYPARLHLTDWIPGRKQWPHARLLTPGFEQQLPLAEVTIAEGLKSAGYATASIGKWHLGGPGFDPERQGFDVNVGGTARGGVRSFFGPFDLPGLQGGTAEDSLTERLTEAAEGFIEQNRGRPFFLYLPEYAVHIPLQARREAIARYQSRVRADNPQRDPIYAAMVESVDQAVGRLERKLAGLGIADRTVVVFTSDNGGLIYEGGSKRPVTSNQPLRAGKGHVYEGGIRVPLIVKGPGIRAGVTSDAPVSSIDHLPTILELAGVRRPSPPGVDGVSLRPVLQQSGRLKRDALFWHYPHYSNQGGVPAGAVRVGNWKLIEFYEDGRRELFDLASDVGERANLAGKRPDKAAELHRALDRWRQAVKAVMPAPNPAYQPAKADQGLTGAEPPSAPQ